MRKHSLYILDVYVIQSLQEYYDIVSSSAQFRRP